jgi:hypothetical protein
MDVILAHNAPYNSDFKSITRLPDQLTHTQRNIASENLVTIFCHPNKVVLNSKYCVATVSVIHFFTLPKAIIIGMILWLEMKSARLKTGVLTLRYGNKIFNMTSRLKKFSVNNTFTLPSLDD